MESPVGQGPNAPWQPSNLFTPVGCSTILQVAWLTFCCIGASENKNRKYLPSAATASEKSRGVSCSDACANGVFWHAAAEVHSYMHFPTSPQILPTIIRGRLARMLRGTRSAVVLSEYCPRFAPMACIFQLQFTMFAWLVSQPAISTVLSY